MAFSEKGRGPFYKQFQFTLRRLTIPNNEYCKPMVTRNDLRNHYKPFVSCTRISLLKLIITCLTKFIQRCIHCVRGFRSCFIYMRSLKVNFVCTCLYRHPHHKHFKHFYYKSRSVDSTVRKVKSRRLVATRDDSTTFYTPPQKPLHALLY